MLSIRIYPHTNIVMIIENRNKSKEKMGNVLACAHYALPQFTIQNAAVSGYASLFYSSALLSMDRQAKRVWDSGRAFAYGFRDRCLSRSYADPASRQAGDADIDTQKQKKRNRFHTSSSYCTGNTICMSGFTETSCVTDCCFVPYAARNCIFTGNNSFVMMPLVVVPMTFHPDAL